MFAILHFLSSVQEQLALTLLQILAGADLAVDFIVSMAMEEFNSLG